MAEETLARSRFVAGLRTPRSGGWDAAMLPLIESIERDEVCADGQAQAACKAIVRFLGVRHPVVEKHYRALTSALHS